MDAKRVSVTFSYIPASDYSADDTARILEALQELGLKKLILATPLGTVL